MAIPFSDHALDRLAARSIDRAWVERTVVAPDRVEVDPAHPDWARAFRGVPERGGRVLRVVYEKREPDIKIVTASLDRGQRPTP